MRDLNIELKQLCRCKRGGSYATPCDRELGLPWSRLSSMSWPIDSRMQQASSRRWKESWPRVDVLATSRFVTTINGRSSMQQRHWPAGQFHPGGENPCRATPPLRATSAPEHVRDQLDDPCGVDASIRFIARDDQCAVLAAPFLQLLAPVSD